MLWANESVAWPSKPLLQERIDADRLRLSYRKVGAEAECSPCAPGAQGSIPGFAAEHSFLADFSGSRWVQPEVSVGGLADIRPHRRA